LCPKQNSIGAKDRLGGISKQGDGYLYSLLTTGALAVVRYAKIHGTGHRPWLMGLLARRPTKIAAIALVIGPEGQKGHLITNALARPFIHLLIPTRRHRRESQTLALGSAKAVPSEPPSLARPIW
jgi:hypothetical protein